MNYSHLNQRDGRLHCEGVDLETLASRYGTPLYVYSLAALREQFRKIDGAFGAVAHRICFSVKTCSNLSLLSRLVSWGAGVDIVSGGELERALLAGANPAAVVFAGVGKSEDEIARAVEAGILFFSVESEPELRRIDEVARRLGLRARVALRVNPDVDARTHHYITTGKKETKFGVDPDTAFALYGLIRSMPALEAAGVQMHIGSQLLDGQPYLEALDTLLALVARLRGELGLSSLRHLDMGGGLGIRYREQEAELDVARLAPAIIERVRPTGLELILEPGRFIAGPSGLLLTRVEYVKRTPAKTFVIVDAAMNDLIRPSLYGAHHEIRPVRAASGPGETVSVVGPVCESGDFLALDRAMPPALQGDLLVVEDAGAYGMAMASNYNSRRRAAEVLVDGDGAQLIRRRENPGDLVRCELPFVNAGGRQTVSFTKMTGTGNDFVVVDDREERFPVDCARVRALCVRQTGVGADGVILVQRSDKADFRMRILNADGSEAEMCGNGARCAVLFARRRGIVRADACAFETGAGLIRAQIHGADVTVELGAPRDLKFDIALSVGGSGLTLHSVNTGVPHVVAFDADADGESIVPLGRAIRRHEFFAPAGTNVNFVRVLGPDAIRVRTYERGVEDETLACGTGMSASALVSTLRRGVRSPVTVHTRGGDLLRVEVDGAGGPIRLTGAAREVFEGEITVS